MRCGTLGASGHVTAKPSIRKGACFINPPSMRRRLSCLPREACLPVRWALGEGRPERGGRQESAEGKVGGRQGEASEALQCRKAEQQIGRAAKADTEGPNR